MRMFIPRTRIIILRTVAILGLLIGLASLAQAYGVSGPVEPELTEREHARLKARVDERWRVVPTRDGLLLVPRQPTDALKGLELTGALLYIDGRPVTGAELYRRLGADAETVLELSYLSSPERIALFPTTQASESPAAAAPDAQREPSDTPIERPRIDRDSSANTPVRALHGARVRVGSNVSVEEHEEISHAFAVFGTAEVKGLVTGDLVAIGGDVKLGPKAVVRGDIMAIGGRIVADPGAIVAGQTTELTTAGSLRWWGLDEAETVSVAVRPDWPRIARAVFSAGIVACLFWFVLSAGILTVAPNAVARARAEAADSPLTALLIGAMVQALFLPVLAAISAVLSLSVIGIPLLAFVPLLACIVAIAALVGFTGVATGLGSRLVGERTPLLALIVGLALVWSAGLAGRYLWMLGADSMFAASVGQGRIAVGLVLAVVGFAVEWGVWTIGLGGATLASLAGRRAPVPAAWRSAPPPVADPPSALSGL